MPRHAALGGPDPVDVHIGRQLRKLRIDRRLSQSKLAQAVGVSFQQLQKYESGANRVAASMLYGLARQLAVPLVAFFEGLPDPALGDNVSEPARSHSPGILSEIP
jgi:transcriptional regulator with XRE-family HTH domain